MKRGQPLRRTGFTPAQRSTQMTRKAKKRAVIETLKPGDPIPSGTPKRYANDRGYIRLRWLVGTQHYVETYEHRVVDGYVTTAEEVHHKNGTRDDNRPENLEPLSKSEHARLHGEGAEHRYYPYRSKSAMERAQRAQPNRLARLERAREMRRLYLDEGLSTVEIAERIGLDASNVSRYLRSIGVTLKPGGHRSRSGTGPAVRVRQIVTARAQLTCEKCGRSVMWTANHIHHRKPRGRGGSSDPAINLPCNLLLLCTECHDWVEQNRTESYKQGWLVHREHDPAVKPVWLASHGYSFLTINGDIEEAPEEEDIAS